MKTADIQTAPITFRSQAAHAVTTTWDFTKRIALTAATALQHFVAACVHNGVRFGSWAAKNIKVVARQSWDLGFRVASLVIKCMQCAARAFADGAVKTVSWMGRAIRFGGHETWSLTKKVSHSVANFGVRFAFAARQTLIAAKNGTAAGYAAGRIYLAHHKRETAAIVFGLALITGLGYGIHHFMSRRNLQAETLPLGPVAPKDVAPVTA